MVSAGRPSGAEPLTHRTLENAMTTKSSYDKKLTRRVLVGAVLVACLAIGTEPAAALLGGFHGLGGARLAGFHHLGEARFGGLRGLAGPRIGRFNGDRFGSFRAPAGAR